jgi:hypothetical protein
MSPCPEIDALLRADAEGRNEFDDHVAGCKGCAAVLALEAFRRLPDRPEDRAGCEDAAPDIAALAAGALDDGGRRRLAAHLAGCARCRETAVRMAFFAGDLDEVPDAVFAAGAGRTEADREPEAARVRERVDGGQRAREPKPRAKWVAAVGGVAAAAAAMVALRVAVLREPESAEDTGMPAGDVATVAASAPVPSAVDAGAPPVPANERGPSRHHGRPAPAAGKRR